MTPLLRVLLSLCATVGVLASCTAQPATLPPDVQLTVDMKDYSIALDKATVKAGTLKIGIRNLGAMEHQFDLIKTDLAPDKLPIDAAQAKAKEDGLVKQVRGIGAGKVATTTADLAAGSYVIICNIAGHYQLGMRVALKVE